MSQIDEEANESKYSQADRLSQAGFQEEEEEEPPGLIKSGFFAKQPH